MLNSLNYRLVCLKIAGDLPRILERCSEDVRKKGYTKQQAIAICTASLQRSGRLKKGTQQLTEKGQESPASHKPAPPGCR